MSKKGLLLLTTVILVGMIVLAFSVYSYMYNKPPASESISESISQSLSESLSQSVSGSLSSSASESASVSASKAPSSSSASRPATSSASQSIAASSSMSNSMSQSNEETFTNFTVETLSGKSVKLSDFRGKPVIINFWATWCSYCVKEMPSFQKYYNDYGSKIHFMMINATDGRRETRDTAKAFIDKNNYTFPVYLDINTKLINEINITSFPTTIVIDKKGKMTNMKIGMLRESDLKSLLDEALK